MVSILVLQAEGLVCTIRYSGFLFQTTSMLTTNEIVKEQMFQTTSKKVLRSSEKQKPHAYRTHSMSGLKVFSGLRLARSLSVSFENYIGYGLLLMKEVLLMN